MKPENLREFAEKLYVAAPRHEEFAKEILDLIEMEENSIEAEIVEELEYHCPEEMHGKDPLKMIEYLGDRDDVLTEIHDKIAIYKNVLSMWGINERAPADVAELVEDLFETLFDLDAILTHAGHKERILKSLVRKRILGGATEKTAAATVVYDL